MPPGLAARLTVLLIERVFDQLPSVRPVTLVHPTRVDTYPKVSAPHPLWFWLSKNGRIGIGNWIIYIKAMHGSLASILAKAALPNFDTISAFFSMRDIETELGPQHSMGQGDSETVRIRKGLEHYFRTGRNVRV